MSSTGLPGLISRHKGSRSYKTLSEDAGGAPADTMFHSYHRGTRVPDPKNVPAVATALGVSEREVWLAMGVTLGFLPDDEPEATPPLFAALSTVPVDMLPDAQVSALVTVITALVRDAIAH